MPRWDSYNLTRRAVDRREAAFALLRVLSPSASSVLTSTLCASGALYT
ncbi:hypothetical protein CCP3SC15_680004 [Gammaproteobacteria bacterium]